MRRAHCLQCTVGRLGARLAGYVNANVESLLPYVHLHVVSDGGRLSRKEDVLLVLDQWQQFGFGVGRNVRNFDAF